MHPLRFSDVLWCHVLLADTRVQLEASLRRGLDFGNLDCVKIWIFLDGPSRHCAIEEILDSTVASADLPVVIGVRCSQRMSY